MKGGYFGIVIVAFLLVVGGVYVFQQTYNERMQNAEVIKQNEAPEPIHFLCAEGKTLSASFSEESVALELSDARTLTLPQVPSGSGFRYELGSTTFIGKGADAFLEERGTQTFANCVANSATSASEASTYTFRDNGKTLRFTYPKDFMVAGGGIGYSTAWQNQSQINGLVFVVATLPKSFAPNTNFSDAKFTIGTSADPSALASCTIAGVGASKPSSVTINGVPYTKIISNDAGAGNFYETTSYRTIRNGQCYTVEYTIHSTNIGNYSPDQGITEFNKAAVTAKLEALVASVTFL